MEQAAELDTDEQRALGVLLEKEQTTPEQYPLTINAVIAGCNQKTNRDPVVQMTETEVVEALDRMRAAAFAWRRDGARVERWEHSVERRWHLTPRRKAILTVLLLRGPQTSGELKTRTDRVHRFESVGEVEEILADLADDDEPKVRRLGRQPGQRGARWMHLLGEDVPDIDADPDVPDVPDVSDVPDAPVATADGPLPSALSSRTPSGLAPSDLERRVARLESTVEALRGRLERLEVGSAEERPPIDG